MKLTNIELQKYFHGALNFKETGDGYLQSFHYTDEQIEYFRNALDFWYERSLGTNSKTIEFDTEATNVSFEYKFAWKGSFDSIELWVDGLPAEIKYVKDLPDEGRISFTMKKGMKSVAIYLTADATTYVRSFEVDAPITPHDKRCRILWLGDSISQGYGPLRSAQTFVSVVNRIWNCEILNQSIGGYIYDKKSLLKIDGFKPDRIVIALGTNQFGDETMAPVEEYYTRLMELYGNDIPVLVISPIWRGDIPEGIPKLEDYCSQIIRIASGYRNVSVINGFELMPRISEYYLDNLHPNQLGCELYGRNLTEAVRKTGWFDV